MNKTTIAALTLAATTLLPINVDASKKDDLEKTRALMRQATTDLQLIADGKCTDNCLQQYADALTHYGRACEIAKRYYDGQPDASGRDTVIDLNHFLGWTEENRAIWHRIVHLFGDAVIGAMRHINKNTNLSWGTILGMGNNCKQQGYFFGYTDFSPSQNKLQPIDFNGEPLVTWIPEEEKFVYIPNYFAGIKIQILRAAGINPSSHEGSMILEDATISPDILNQRMMVLHSGYQASPGTLGKVTISRSDGVLKDANITKVWEHADTFMGTVDLSSTTAQHSTTIFNAWQRDIAEAARNAAAKILRHSIEHGAPKNSEIIAIIKIAQDESEVLRHDESNASLDGKWSSYRKIFSGGGSGHIKGKSEYSGASHVHKVYNAYVDFYLSNDAGQ